MAGVKRGDLGPITRDRVRLWWHGLSTDRQRITLGYRQRDKMQLRFHQLSSDEITSVLLAFRAYLEDVCKPSCRCVPNVSGSVSARRG